MAVGAYGGAAESDGCDRREPEVELRYRCVARIAQVPCRLMSQQVTIGATVRIMASGAPFHARRPMLEDKGTFLIGVALAAWAGHCSKSW